MPDRMFDTIDKCSDYVAAKWLHNFGEHVDNLDLVGEILVLR